MHRSEVSQLLAQLASPFRDHADTRDASVREASPPSPNRVGLDLHPSSDLFIATPSPVNNNARA
jgi:hypothetical protein